MTVEQYFIMSARQSGKSRKSEELLQKIVEEGAKVAVIRKGDIKQKGEYEIWQNENRYPKS